MVCVFGQWDTRLKTKNAVLLHMVAELIIITLWNTTTANRNNINSLYWYQNQIQIQKYQKFPFPPTVLLSFRSVAVLEEISSGSPVPHNTRIYTQGEDIFMGKICKILLWWGTFFLRNLCLNWPLQVINAGKWCCSSQWYSIMKVSKPEKYDTGIQVPWESEDIINHSCFSLFTIRTP